MNMPWRFLFSLVRLTCVIAVEPAMSQFNSGQLKKRRR